MAGNWVLFYQRVHCASSSPRVCQSSTQSKRFATPTNPISARPPLPTAVPLLAPLMGTVGGREVVGLAEAELLREDEELTVEELVVARDDDAAEDEELLARDEDDAEDELLARDEDEVGHNVAVTVIVTTPPVLVGRVEDDELLLARDDDELLVGPADEDELLLVGLADELLLVGGRDEDELPLLVVPVGLAEDELPAVLGPVEELLPVGRLDEFPVPVGPTEELLLVGRDELPVPGPVEEPPVLVGLAEELLVGPAELVGLTELLPPGSPPPAQPVLVQRSPGLQYQPVQQTAPCGMQPEGPHRTWPSLHLPGPGHALVRAQHVASPVQYSVPAQKALLPSRQHVAAAGTQLLSHTCWPAGHVTGADCRRIRRAAQLGERRDGPRPRAGSVASVRLAASRPGSIHVVSAGSSWSAATSLGRSDP
ncbi:hypothetical protein GGTG_08849 [Gaeumannomyces tritici R3-111a-1]|uniref:Uncharacterized protein n=1 Tax=Gaeumannomyces tritici (strain R3-111a-1) TaxID=644352 RepID=J3P5Q9_GAET3|nr:hypothetical protein GGTG_08849 [Gaeumannomyces tritici R3-111a-1]EJT75011.1 hypothetical protein GGTG_08849 [Gaeumannomyces tritici R3-111a-1]